MTSILNLNKKIQDKKVKEFEEKAQKCAMEMNEILIKYELKIVPFIHMSSLGDSPLISGMKAQYTFAPMNQTELESIKLKQKRDDEATTQSDTRDVN